MWDNDTKAREIVGYFAQLKRMSILLKALHGPTQAAVDHHGDAEFTAELVEGIYPPPAIGGELLDRGIEL
jgi:hypothetical protein